MPLNITAIVKPSYAHSLTVSVCLLCLSLRSSSLLFCNDHYPSIPLVFYRLH